MKIAPGESPFFHAVCFGWRIFGCATDRWGDVQYKLALFLTPRNQDLEAVFFQLLVFSFNFGSLHWK